MELRDYLRVLRKRWLVIAALTVLAVAGAAAATALATPQYESRTRLFVSAQGGSSSNELLQGNSFIQQRVQSYAQIVTGDRVLRRAIADAELDTRPAELAERVTAEAPLNTVLIDITVTDTSAERAAVTANAIGDSFIDTVDLLEEPASPGAGSPVRVSTVEEADVPQEPASPDPLLNLALGLLVGLALGVGVAVLRETLDTRVRGEADTTRAGLPLLGATPYAKDASRTPLVVRDDPLSARAESFRQLRTNLQFVAATGETRSFVVTSSVESEGKTTTAINLALTLASAGTRVALVDADLRRPRVARYLGLEGVVGLTTVLVGRATLSEVMQPFGGSGVLDVLPAGEVPPNASELLASETMAKTLRELEHAYDVVLLDGAPLLPVTDSAVLARISGGAILVVAAGRTTRPALERAVTSLRSVDARVLGAVLTMVPTKGADAQQTYGYYGEAVPRRRRLGRRGRR